MAVMELQYSTVTEMAVASYADEAFRSFSPHLAQSRSQGGTTSSFQLTMLCGILPDCLHISPNVGKTESNAAWDVPEPISVI